MNSILLRILNTIHPNNNMKLDIVLNIDLYVSNNLFNIRYIHNDYTHYIYKGIFNINQIINNIHLHTHFSKNDFEVNMGVYMININQDLDQNKFNI